MNNFIIRIKSFVLKLRTMYDKISRIDMIQDEVNNIENEHIIVDDPVDLFVLKNKRYRTNKKPEEPHRRLFITGGTMTLLTAISILKTLKKDNCENYLIIYTGVRDEQNRKFIECNANIAELYDFKKIIFLQNRKNTHQIIRYGMEKIDEIYMYFSLERYSRILEQYPDVPCTFFDHALIIFVNFINLGRNIKKFILHNYFGKINVPLALHESNIALPVEYINEKIFQETIEEIRKKLNIEIETDCDKKVIEYDTETKYVLLCGSHPSICRIKKSSVKKTAQMLQAKGYKVLFKKHPRDDTKYNFNADIMPINTPYPLELYKLNVVALVCYLSSTSITVPFFCNIPAFSEYKNVLLEEDKFFKLIQHQYSVPIEILLEFDHEKLSVIETRESLMKIYNEHIKNIPEISNNEIIQKYIKRVSKHQQKD